MLEFKEMGQDDQAPDKTPEEELVRPNATKLEIRVITPHMATLSALDHIDGPSSKAFYQDLFLRSIDAIALVDLSTGKILEGNDPCVAFFRLPLDKLHNSEVFEYCQEEALAEFRKMIRIASRRYHPKLFEIPMKVGDPEKPVFIVGEMAASPLKLNDDSEVLQLIFRDITAQKEAEKKIQNYIKKIEESNYKLEELATTDGMTGLTNFRHFSKLLEAEHLRAARYKSSYALVFCDIDHFKKYNDQNGHPAGDALLKHFAKVLRACARNTDVPARYGGEEFIVLCPETNAEQARILAERIRATIASIKYPFSEKQPLGFVSCSVGVASFPADGSNTAEVLKSADALLYQAKNAGRNQVMVSSKK